MAVSAQTPSTNRKSSRNRRFVFLPNTQAGAVLGGTARLAGVRDALRAGGEVIDVPAEAGTLPERVAMAKDLDADCIVVAGGDGTMACAATALLGGSVTLGLVPCGTMNLLARDLGLDPGDPDGVAQAILHGGTRRIDAATVNGHVFLCASMLGTPARLGRVREAGRRRGNGPRAWAGLMAAGFRALLRNRLLRLVLTTGEGHVVPCRTPALTITVNVLSDGSARRFGRDTLDGGVLGIYIVRRGSALRQAMAVLRTLVTGKLKTPHVEFLAAREVTVQGGSAGLHVMLDGEPHLLQPPLRYAVAPGALCVAGGQ